MRAALSLALLLGCCSLSLGKDKETGLRHLFKRSEVVMAGEVTSEPVVTLTPGAARIRFTVKLTKLLRYRLLEDYGVGSSQPLIEGDEYPLEITRFDQSSTDRPPYLQKGTKCIVFLKGKVRHQPYPLVVPGDLTDAWLGVQPYSSLLERRLIAFGEAEKKKLQKE